MGGRFLFSWSAISTILFTLSSTPLPERGETFWSRRRPVGVHGVEAKPCQHGDDLSLVLRRPVAHPVRGGIATLLQRAAITSGARAAPHLAVDAVVELTSQVGGDSRNLLFRLLEQPLVEDDMQRSLTKLSEGHEVLDAPPDRV